MVSYQSDPVPTGIIILDYSPATIVKGDRIKVKLRINPSGFKVTKENIELDAWYSDTYFLKMEKAKPVPLMLLHRTIMNW